MKHRRTYVDRTGQRVRRSSATWAVAAELDGDGDLVTETWHALDGTKAGVEVVFLDADHKMVGVRSALWMVKTTRNAAGTVTVESWMRVRGIHGR